VDIGSVDGITHDGLGCARVDLDVAPTDCLQDGPRVVRRLIQCSVAMNGAYTKQLDARIVGAEEEGVRILRPRISNQWGSASFSRDSHHAQCPWEVSSADDDGMSEYTHSRAKSASWRKWRP